MYTMQEAFEIVSRHLFAQGQRSVQSTNTCITNTQFFTCAYRGSDGMKCAIGVLIPDNEYLAEMDDFSRNTGIDTILVEFAPKCLTGLDENFMISLQCVHDNKSYWGSSDPMRCILVDVGEKYDLDTSFLNGLSFSDR